MLRSKFIKGMLAVLCSAAIAAGPAQMPVYAAGRVQAEAQEAPWFQDFFEGLFHNGGPSLNKEEVELELGEKYCLTVRKAKGKVKWKSSDEKVAKVSRTGTVTAAGAGDAVITAKADGRELSCRVHVCQAEFCPSEPVLKAGESVPLKAEIGGRAAQIKGLSSSDSSVASISRKGLIKTRDVGKADLTVQVHGVRYTVKVSVIPDQELSVGDIPEGDIEGCRNILEDYLDGKDLVLKEIIRAFDVKMVDSHGQAVEPGEETEVRIEDVGQVPEGAALFHIADGDHIEELDFSIEDGALIFRTSSFSPFLLAETEAKAPQQYGLSISLDSNGTVNTKSTLFFAHDGDIGYTAGFTASFVGPDGTLTEVDINDVTFTPAHAPSEPGPFQVTFSYTADDGVTYEFTVEMVAVYPEPLMSVKKAGDAAGYAGNINGKSLKYIIFTDAPEPGEGEAARKWYIGQDEPTAVVAWRPLGDEETLYISSCRPGVKVIHPGEGRIFAGYVYEVDCRMLDTSRCTSVQLFSANSGAFQYGVRKINCSGCDFSGVENLTAAYNTYRCLQYLDLSGCDFSNVRTASHMCYYTPSLISVDLSGAVFSDKLTNCEYMFGRSGLQQIDLGGLDTTNVTTVQGMFVGDKNLVSVDMSGCDLSNVTSAAYMFQDCRSLEKVVFHEAGMPSLEGSIRQMFDYCQKLQDVDLSGINFSNVTNVFRAFYHCDSLQTTMNIDATNFDTSYGYTFADMATGEDADVTINCTQASKDKLVGKKMIWSTNGSPQHVAYNVTDAPTISPLSGQALEDAAAAVSAFAESRGTEVDEVLFAAEVVSNGSSKAEVTGMEVPEGAILCRITEDGAEGTEFSFDKGTLSFTFDSGSSYVLITLKEAHAEVPEGTDGPATEAPGTEGPVEEGPQDAPGQIEEDDAGDIPIDG